MKLKETLGTKLSPIFVEIQDTLIENYETKPNFTQDGFIAGTYIFQTVILDKIWELQETENIPMNIREDIAVKCGTEIRALIKKYCNIDTHEFFNK